MARSNPEARATNATYDGVSGNLLYGVLTFWSFRK